MIPIKRSWVFSHNFWRQGPRTNFRDADILRARPTTPTRKSRAIAYMEQTGTFEYTQHVLASLLQDAEMELQRLGGNPRLAKLLESFRVL